MNIAGNLKAKAREVHVEVNASACRKCGICVKFCPQKVLSEDSFGAVTVVDVRRCTACRLCELYCPDVCILVREEAH